MKKYILLAIVFLGLQPTVHATTSVSDQATTGAAIAFGAGALMIINSFLDIYDISQEMGALLEGFEDVKIKDLPRERFVEFIYLQKETVNKMKYLLRGTNLIALSGLFMVIVGMTVDSK